MLLDYITIRYIAVNGDGDDRGCVDAEMEPMMSNSTTNFAIFLSRKT